MARERKPRKRLLKEPDEFITTTTRVLKFIGAHRRWVVVFTVGVVMIILIGLIVRGHLKKVEAEAGDLYSQAYQQFRNAMDGFLAEEGTKDGFESALKGFDRIISEFPRTRSALMAKLYRGHCLYQLGRYDDAIKAYEDFLLRQSKETSLIPYVIQGLAYSYRAKGDYRESNRLLEKILEKEGGGSLRRSVLVEIGKNHELLGEADKAIKIYEDLLKEYPDDRTLNPIMDRLKELKARGGSSR